MFFPPLPAKPGCSHLRELDYQRGWMETGLPQYQGGAGSWQGLAVPSTVPLAPRSVSAALLSPQKHPDFPKKPLTPYFRFFMEKRAKYAKLHPEMSNLDLTKILSKKYKELPEKKKVRGGGSQQAPSRLCASACRALPAQALPVQPAEPSLCLVRVESVSRWEKAGCLFSLVRPVRLPFLFLSWFPGSVGWRLAGSVRWSVSSRRTWMVTLLLGGSVFNAGVKSHASPWLPCLSEGWRDGLCSELWEMLGGEVPISPPALEVAMGLARPRRARTRILGSPALSLGGFVTGRKGPGHKVLLCPLAQDCLGGERGDILPPNPWAGWKPSAGSCRTGQMGWRALGSLCGVVGCPVDRDVSPCLFRGADVPLSTSLVAVCPQMKYIQDFQREKQEFERNLARFR